MNLAYSLFFVGVMLTSAVTSAPAPDPEPEAVLDTTSVPQPSSSEAPEPEPSSPQTPELPTSSETPCNQNVTDVYDTSQEGENNYKVKVKGFTLLLAPSDTILGAAMLMGGMGDEKLGQTLQELQKERDEPVAKVGMGEKLPKLLKMIRGMSHNQ